jgi:hypothetical protein
VEHSKELLKSAGLAYSGIRADLRVRLEAAFLNGELAFEKGVALLHKIEGWGLQHIYFFKSPAIIRAEWENAEKVNQRVSVAGMTSLLGAKPGWFVPNEPKIETISFENFNLRITVVMPRSWHERDAKYDEQNGDVIKKGFRERKSRALATFEWNVRTGHGFLMIPQLKKGNGYLKEKANLASILYPIINISHFEVMSLENAIRKSEQDRKALMRSLTVETVTGEGVVMRSRSKQNDVRESTKIVEVRECLKDSLPNDGNFYFAKVSEPDSRFRGRMHPDHRFSIFSEIGEEEVRNAISNIQSTFG